MEFEKAFSKPEKVTGFRKNGRGHGISFLVQIFCAV